MFEKKEIQLNNVVLEWPFLGMINDKGNFPTHKYQVTLVLDEKQLEVLNSVPHPRQNPKKCDDGKYRFTVKSTKQPRVVDINRMPMDIEEVKKIGNGTIASVRLSNYLGYMNTPFLGLSAVKVNEMKAFVAGAGNQWEDDGYSVEETTSDDEMPWE